MALPHSFVALLALCLLPTVAWGDRVILNDGREIEGEATVDPTTGQVVVERGGAKLTFKADEVRRVIEDSPAAASEPPQVVVIPLQGSFDHLRAARVLDRTLDKAFKLQPKLIIYEISSPGGRIDVARAMVKHNLAIQGVTTVAYVTGPTRGAYSAAAYFSTSCDVIVMAPGNSIGAAVAYQPSSKGPRAVNEKFHSAWRADFRAVAEAKGHPAAIVLAMVDIDVGVAEVKIGGERRFVSARSLDALEAQTKRRRVAFERVRTICRPGKVLTLTSKEAVRARLARAVVSKRDTIITKYKLDPRRVKRFGDPLSEAAKAFRKVKKAMDKDLAKLKLTFRKIEGLAPSAQRYQIDRATRRFLDKGAAWRQHTDKTQKVVRRALKRLKEIDAQHRKHPDLTLDTRDIERLRQDLEEYQAKLKAQKFAKSLPRS
jgi:hypothetical protein